jgi:sigma-E factor negative regulatory protein RseA
VFRWKMVAGLASFAAVAGIGWGMLGSLGPQPGAGGLWVQSAPTVSTQVAALAQLPSPKASAEASGAETEAEAGSGVVMLRDPRLDELLAAHRQTSGASALGDAAGFLRNATFEAAGR